MHTEKACTHNKYNAQWMQFDLNQKYPHGIHIKPVVSVNPPSEVS